jgi:hypothetical protein
LTGLHAATRKDTTAQVTEPGDYAIFALNHATPASGIMFICPHPGCGDKCHLPLQPKYPGGWTWDETTKTLHPSVQRLDKTRCEHHFSLVNGDWIP